MAKKRKAPILLFLLMSAAGAGIMLYPTVSDAINGFRQTKAIAAYHTELTQTADDRIQGILEEAGRYNEKLRNLNGAPYNSGAMHAEYEAALRLDGSDVIGYVEIPKIKVYLPIFHDANEATLAVGVGHVEGTSLPVGGEGTHTALSGHRGLPSAKLFTNLDKMEKGDIFMVHVLNDTLYYKVEEIDAVLPEQVGELSIQPGRDLATLVTCTPYGLNTHRLLVTGARIAESELPEGMRALPPRLPSFDWRNQPIVFPIHSKILLAGAALALVVRIVLEARSKRLLKGRPRVKRRGAYNTV